jgi:ATP-dependent DNA ligase
MLLLPAEIVPEGPGWTYELKLDGFRALAIKTGGLVRLRSRNDKDFNGKYPTIARALATLPDDTVVAGDADGRPSFNAFQNGSAGVTIVYYVFGVMPRRSRRDRQDAGPRREMFTRDMAVV